MRRSTKYLNAREYALMLRRADHADVPDFAEAFLEALDFLEDSVGREPTRALIDRATAGVETENLHEQIEHMSESTRMLATIEELIDKSCPEFEDMDADDAVAEMIKRLYPGDVQFLGKQKLEYDL